MKKLILLAVILVVVGCLTACSTVTYHKTSPDGATEDVVIKRPVFATVNYADKERAVSADQSAQFNQNMNAIKDIMKLALEGYAKSQTIPVPTSAAIPTE